MIESWVFVGCDCTIHWWTAVATGNMAQWSMNEGILTTGVTSHQVATDQVRWYHTHELSFGKLCQHSTWHMLQCYWVELLWFWYSYPVTVWLWHAWWLPASYTVWMFALHFFGWQWTGWRRTLFHYAVVLLQFGRVRWWACRHMDEYTHYCHAMSCSESWLYL